MPAVQELPARHAPSAPLADRRAEGSPTTSPLQTALPSPAACAIGALMHAYLGPTVGATAAALRWDALHARERDTGRANDAIVDELAWNHPHRHWIRLALADAITCLQRTSSAD